MKNFIGLSLIVLGVFLGFFVGVWLCLIGGIVQIIETLKSPEGINALSIGIGIARIVCAGLAGFISAFTLILPGYGLTRK